jgi:hypothetical protein
MQVIVNPCRGHRHFKYMQDPNLQLANEEVKAEGQPATNDAVQATEQEAQENAMESEG